MPLGIKDRSLKYFSQIQMCLCIINGQGWSLLLMLLIIVLNDATQQTDFTHMHIETGNSYESMKV